MKIERKTLKRIFDRALLRSVALFAIIGASGAHAQSTDSAFAGPYIGLAGGAVDHHFVAVENTADGSERSFNVTQWGVGGELFAGYDLALSPTFIVGAEAQLEIGGRKALAVDRDYVFGFKPRYGFSLSGRIGYRPTPDLLAYAGAGYGEHRYRTVALGNVSREAANSLDSTRSFVLRTGTEWRLTRRANLRLEFEHLDGSRNQFMLGVPIRF